MTRAMLALAIAAGCVGLGVARAEDPVVRGAYLTRIMGCNDCHTPGAFLGKPDLAHPLSGSDVGFQVPGLGIHWGPNLTPDAQTGLGTWTDAQIITALRTGVTPEGRRLIPSMPYMAYAVLTDADAQAIVAFLRSLPPVHHAVPGPIADGQPAPAPFLTIVVPK